MALKEGSVLYISYNGMLDPLGQSQVIPYLRELSKAGVRFTLVSFERPSAWTFEGTSRCLNLKRELAEEGIKWHWLRYHKAPSLPATSYDVLAGIRLGGRLVRDNQIEMVHARSHIPATIAMRLKNQFGLKMIFDVRGLMADEYVDAGHWRKNSLPYWITKSAERRALAAADGVVTLTERIWPIIKEWEGLHGREVPHEVVPCCADLELFKFSAEQRTQRRLELGVKDAFVLVYSGSIDGWYLTESMADFFTELRKRRKTHFLWMTPSRHERIRTIMRDRSISEHDYTVLAADSRDVPSFLSAADAALAFIKPCFSKLASSPTKYAEYLACGLPLIINAGIGDSDDLIVKEKAGVLIRDFDSENYAQAVTRILGFAENVAETRRHSRAIAEQLFDLRRIGVTRYADLYEAVLNRS